MTKRRAKHIGRNESVRGSRVSETSRRSTGSPGKRESLDSLPTSNSKKRRESADSSGAISCEGEKYNFSQTTCSIHQGHPTTERSSKIR